MPIRDWPKRKLVRLWLGGAFIEALLVLAPLFVQPSPAALERRAVALQDSVRASMGPAINLDTLPVAERDSLVSLARKVTGKAVAQAGMGVVVSGLLTLAVYLVVPAALIWTTAVWFQEHKLHREHGPAADA